MAAFARSHNETYPHLPPLDGAGATIAFHMARVMAKSIPRKHKYYSLDFLKERGIEHDGRQWIQPPRPEGIIAQGVGIIVKSSDPRVQQRIHRAMQDALLDAIAGGITEAPTQRERMLKARQKQRDRMALS